MKKMTIVFFCILVVSMNSFAEFVISPKIGYANISTLETFRYESQSVTSIVKGEYLNINSWNNLAMSVDMGFIGKSGFTFFFNNNVSLLGSINKSISSLDVDMKFKDLKGAYWNGELLFGYTFKKSKTYITLAGGIGAGGCYDMKVGKIAIGEKSIDIKDLLKVRALNLGFALHISTMYYFTENIGLAFSLTGTPGYGFYFARLNEEKLGIFASSIDKSLLNSSGGFSNVFCLKLGPVFKF